MQQAYVYLRMELRFIREYNGPTIKKVEISCQPKQNQNDKHTSYASFFPSYIFLTSIALRRKLIFIFVYFSLYS